MSNEMEKNFKFVEDNQKKLLKSYVGKFLLVYKEKVVNTFDTYDAAAREGIRLYGGEGKFLVYHLTKEPPVNLVLEAVL